jgi:hypothetical protein
MKMYGELKVQLYAFLNSALDGGEWLASPPARFTPSEKAPGTYWIGDWLSLWSGLDAVAKDEISAFAGNRSPVV